MNSKKIKKKTKKKPRSAVGAKPTLFVFKQKGVTRAFNIQNWLECIKFSHHNFFFIRRTIDYWTRSCQHEKGWWCDYAKFCDFQKVNFLNGYFKRIKKRSLKAVFISNVNSIISQKIDQFFMKHQILNPWNWIRRIKLPFKYSPNSVSFHWKVNEFLSADNHISKMKYKNKRKPPILSIPKEESVTFDIFMSLFVKGWK